MRMLKGLCIELNEDYSVFIGPNGEFVHGTPARITAVGEESYFYPKQEVPLKKRKAMNPVWAPIMAAAAVAVLFLSVLLPRQEAFAYVQVQVNPGIELGIDETYEVISMRELNEDGREVIGELGEWKHHPLEEILDEVIGLAMEETTDEIVITTVADDEDAIADEAVVNSVMAISAKVMAGNVTVKLKEASRTQWRTSVEKNVPVGQLISDSKSIKNNKPEEQTIKKPAEKPLKAKEKKATDDQPKKNESQSEEQVPKKEQKTPVNKEKTVPTGQEKRQETPEAENGKLLPSGQDKRTEVQGQKKKDEDSIESDKPEPKKAEAQKEKEVAPAPQKKKDETGGSKEKAEGKDDSSPAKSIKDQPKPGIAGPQNSAGKKGSK
ncbi:anti-sigma-I factor RsgI family protein [Planococcus salinarum]|uniref:anti-sigma-I factor RsgI family protein n=1 Tax=Planococcus salinarum TaxID=622695 RepID=UPI000E3EC889|nr:hypothetical protein [Planococcus salinarum]TAA72166.1 hypothetical protein D2909_08210 [Planococcus salinarum]